MKTALLTLTFLAFTFGQFRVALGVDFPKDSGYVNIREKYGAKGDGVTDDTAAFQITARGSQLEVLAAFLYANRGTDSDSAAFDLTDSTLTASYVNHLGGHYRPQIRARRDGSLAEVDLWLNLNNPNNPIFTHRHTRDGKTLTESTMTKRDQDSPLRAYRHGSYGVKVPLVLAQ